MNNWFYMSRMTFTSLLNDELGPHLTGKLLSLDFDHPVSFMIGKTADEILTKIQQTFSRQICGKLICHHDCVSCSLSPPTYAKLIWFVQRLLIMSPLRQPFTKQISLSNKDFSCIAKTTDINIEENGREILAKSNNSNEDCSEFATKILIILCFAYFLLPSSTSQLVQMELYFNI
ncbi:unnamed protein product [Rotaria socialis]|uniref:Uncharacterized protein n=1 Tax=Rotaria socialis TaxID=392032 RepID=A0A817X800_9BILA|nr:unnamed protein product [Rotaria socialis]CAF3347599.1 unnamed protein product [Rotaria socialis]CAF3364069.1 unnamed protein product [Rotaria socialis]CAF4368504.1 unnamed protein product [Rotaria socialis]CAF4380999.1 unnamed protein product [Rotaria socialis]